MDNYEIIKRLENAKDLETEPQRLQDFVDMGRNIFLVDNDFEEGKRVCFKGRDIALKLARIRHDSIWYKIYLKALLHLARYFRDFDSYLIYVEHNRDPEEQFYLVRRECFRKIGIVQAFQDMLDDKLDLLTISLPPGTGKGQRENAKILTPTGFKRFGDLKLGDRVISGTGKLTTVEGIFPKPSMAVYELTFDDGSKVQCSKDHIWHVQTREDRKRNKYRDIELSKMLDNYRVENGRRLNYSIDYVPVIDCFEEHELLLDPYLMGVLLGDGGLSTNSVMISLPDKEIYDEVVKRLPEGYELSLRDHDDYRVIRSVYRNRWAKNDVVEILKSYNLMGLHSNEKFIPREYLYASYEQRLELLRGLLDTDGYAYEHGIEYTTVSKELAENMTELVHSLGGYCSVSEKANSGYRKGETFIKCKTAYRLNIQFSAEQPKPLRLTRKAERYNPKRKVLKRFITDIKYVGDEKTSCIYVADESHLYITDDYIITHNTTLEGFFASYVMGLDPGKCNLFSSYSGSITEMFHRSAYNIITNKEYAWADVFPGVKIESKSDKEEFINLGKYKPFKTLQCRSINSSTTGVTRAEGYLMCDDLVSGIEEALNPERLESLYMKYVSDLKSRRKLGCKEIHIATRWSVHDPIGHLIAMADDSPRSRFIAVDCYDENGESQFNFKYGKGFDTAYFNEMEAHMDDVTFRCMFRSDPIEREGLLYHDDELMYYLGGLPAEENGKTKEADAILAICDTKDTGTDFNCLLVVYQYGDRFYLDDLVYDNGSPYVLDEMNANCLVKNHVQMAQFESNKEGSRTGDQVAKIVKEKGGHCQILKKYTTTNKETKIIVNSDWVKKHVYFKDKSELEPKGMYRKFLTDMCRYVTLGKNKHDDSVDALAMLALFVQNLAGSVAEVYDRRELGI